MSQFRSESIQDMMGRYT